MAVGVKIRFDPESGQVVANSDEATVGGEDGRHRIFWRSSGQYPIKIVFDNPAEWNDVFASTYPTGGAIRLAGAGLGRRARKSATYAVKTKKQGRRAVTIQYTATALVDGTSYLGLFSIKSKL